ncbi:PilX N-terminal domain-containing pilus assembly protein [Planctomycetota bacterium]
MQNKKRQPGGIVLLVVIGVLALMSVLAITFVSMTRLERSVSRNYVDRTRAIMAAESGVEYAVKRVANFRGGVLRAHEAADLQFQDWDYSLPLETAGRPSFRLAGKPYSGIVSSSSFLNSDRYKLKVADLSSRINLNDSNLEWNMPPGDPNYGKRRLKCMISYLCDLIYGEGVGDAIALTIQIEKDTKLGGRFTSMNEVRELLVENEDIEFSQQDWILFEQYFTVHSWRDGTVLRPTFKVDISVPGGGSAPLNDDGGADLYLYLDMQTKLFELDSRSPVNINTASREVIETLFANVAGWYLREDTPENLSDGHYGSWLQPQGVSFQYCYLDETLTWRTDMSWGSTTLGKRNSSGVITRTSSLSDPASPTFDYDRLPVIADITWDRIHDQAHPNPFETWDEFEMFLNDELNTELSGRKITPLDEFEVDALLANFNPNSQLNDYNPNLSIYRHIDKSQLTAYTTELCFEPTGYFEILSCGEIRGTDNSILSSSKVKAVVKIFEYFRQTTQAQFMAGYHQESDLSWYFSLSNGLPTALAGLDTVEGYSLQSYPEPVTSENYMADSVFDGKLMLATWQPELMDYEIDVSEYLASGEVPEVINDVEGGFPYKPEPILRATFRQDIKPEDFGNNPYTEFLDIETCGDYFYIPWKKERSTHLFNNPTNDPLTHGMDPDDPLPGSVFPDGALSDGCRTVGFAAGNFGKCDGKIGAMHFWIKPNFDPGNSTRIRSILLTYRNQFGWTGPREQSLYYFCNNNENKNEESADYYNWDMNGAWVPPRSFIVGWGFSIENNVGLMSPTVNHNFPEHNDSTCSGHSFPEYNFDSHMWSHIGLSWNTKGPGDSGFGFGAGPEDTIWFLRLAVNGEDIPSTRGMHFTGDFRDSPKQWIDPIHSHGGGPNIIRFGESVLGHRDFPVNIDGSGQPDGFMNYSGDHTIDDVVGYLDFVPGVQMEQFWHWGRYYNENDATYTSPPIDLHRALKLDRREVLRPRSVSWTVYWPENNREYTEVADNIRPPNVDGDALDTDNPNDTVPDDPLAAKWGEPLDPVSINIGLDVPGFSATEWMFENTPENMLTYAGGSPFLKTYQDSAKQFLIAHGVKFRYCANFHLATNPANQTLYDTPVFDDISFTFNIRPKVLSWQVIN